MTLYLCTDLDTPHLDQAIEHFLTPEVSLMHLCGQVQPLRPWDNHYYDFNTID